MENNGSFKKKKVYFSQVSNNVIRDNNLSLKAKGLYSLIQSYITIENFILYKNTLKKCCKEKEKAFESAWNELKTNGCLVQEKHRDMKGNYYYLYDLLDIVHTPKKEGVDNACMDNGGYILNTKLNNTDINNNNYNDNGITSSEDDTLYINIKNSRRYFCDRYERKYNKPYHRHKAEQNKIIDSKLKEAFIDNYLELENMEEMIDKYFSNVNCDHNLMHFVSDGIIENRVYEIS